MRIGLSKRLIGLLVVLCVQASLSLGLPAPALADDTHLCEHDMTTIASLRHCVLHAADMGHIDNNGIVTALLDKLDAAQAAVDRDENDVAANVLRAFIHQVDAQSGVHIASEHAMHLIEHAQNVLDALSGQT
jgi:hypothetical protein